jgi:hypothetical protein
MNNVVKQICQFSTVGLLLASVGCAVDAGESAQGPDATGTTTFGISDATSSSFATVTISSADSQDLALGADDFELIAITAADLAAEGEAAAAEGPEEGDGAADEEADEPEDTTTIELSDEVLADGVVAVELVERGAPDYRAPFRDRYYYSQEEGAERTASVTRQSYWHKVYASIYYSTEEDGSWGSLVSNYKLKNKETITKDGPRETYQMRIKVRARKTKHYSVGFDR